MRTEPSLSELELKEAGLKPPAKANFARGLLVGLGVGATVVLAVVALTLFPVLSGLIEFLGDVFAAFVEAFWGH